jgi:hypothetical protein
MIRGETGAKYKYIILMHISGAKLSCMALTRLIIDLIIHADRSTKLCSRTPTFSSTEDSDPTGSWMIQW